MAVNENVIRSQTASILEAYHLLTGGSAIPSVAEFLEIRRQAEEELCKGFAAGQKTSLPKEEPAAVPVKRAETVKTVKPDPSVKARHVAKKTDETPVVREEAELDEEASEPVNDFDILRSLADPWN